MINKLRLQVYNQHSALIFSKDLEDRCALPKLVKDPKNPVPFSCVRGFCGACLVQVIDGEELLEPPEDEEIMTIENFTASDYSTRLLCQTKIKDLNSNKILRIKIRTFNEDNDF